MNFDYHPSNFSIANQIGTKHSFHVLYQPSTGFVTTQIDTTLWYVTTFDPFYQAVASGGSNFGPEPWSVQYNGEALYLDDNVPGQAAAQAAMNAMGVQGYWDNVNVLIPCGFNFPQSDSSNWANSTVGCTNSAIWTVNP